MPPAIDMKNLEQTAFMGRGLLKVPGGQNRRVIGRFQPVRFYLKLPSREMISFTSSPKGPPTP